MDFIDKYNTIVGACIAVLSAILGQFWYLFAFFLLFNVLDWITGTYKARKLKIESSGAGRRGIIKKLLSWVIVLVGFALPVALVEPGRILFGLDLSILTLFGWFVLASLMINEARSILENLVEAGHNVPNFLIGGLAITQKLIQGKVEGVFPSAGDKGEGE